MKLDKWLFNSHIVTHYHIVSFFFI